MAKSVELPQVNGEVLSGYLPSSPSPAPPSDQDGGNTERPEWGSVSVKSLLDLVTTVAAPIAVLSALMLYFGWVRTRTLFSYFGVDVSQLGFTTTDYVLRSADVLFRPAIFATLASGAFWALGTVAARIERSSRPWTRSVGRTLLIGSAAGCFVGAMLMVQFFGNRHPYAAGYLLALTGALLLVIHRLRSVNKKPPVVLGVFGGILLVIAAFVLVFNYAQDAGTRTAIQIAKGDSRRPLANIYSSVNLQLPRGQPIPPNNGPWNFRYSGYRVLAYANNRWFIIPVKWTESSSTVTLLDDKSIRVDVQGSR